MRETGKTVAIAGLVDDTGLALARAHAMPGVRLCLIGAAGALAVAAEDCRRRGAIVNTFASDGQEPENLASRLKTVDEERPIDVLAVQAGPDLGHTMAIVEPLLEPLRRRRRGAIVLIGARSEELRRFSDMVRQDLRSYGVAVMVASPGLVAARLAARFRRSEIAGIGADKMARLICRGVSRRRKAVALPRAGTALIRTLRLSSALLRERLATPAEPVTDPVAKEPLPEQAASGN